MSKRSAAFIISAGLIFITARLLSGPPLFAQVAPQSQQVP
jgi:hypothetical protein